MDIILILTIVFSIIFIVWLLFFITYQIEKKELKTFNKVHKTTYDFDTWKLYSLEIKRKENLFKSERPTKI